MLILASQSPRRSGLLRSLGLEFTVSPSSHEEPLDTSRPAGEAVAHIALMKARDVAGRFAPEDVIIAADTMVFVDGTPLGKPIDAEDAGRMLRMLSGREHTVITGMAVLRGGEEQVEHVSTAVRFLPLTERQIEWYVATGEPLDKAGAYGVQGLGGLLVDTIDGDYYNVVGLPIAPLARMLLRAGVDVFRSPVEIAR